MFMFKFKAPRGLPKVSDSWIADPAVRAVRVYFDDDDDSIIILQMFGNGRYLRAAMTSEEARALGERLMDVAYPPREDKP